MVLAALHRTVVARLTIRTTSRRCCGLPRAVRQAGRIWLGTDRNGYDVLTRVIYGAPTALAVGLGAMLIASLIGVLVGGIAGYRRRAWPTRC